MASGLDKQPVTAHEAYGLFTELPVSVQSEIVAAHSYLSRVQIARKYFPTLAEATGIARICTPPLELMPTAVIRAEVNRRTAKEHPQPRKLEPCAGCGTMLGARERRKACPKCGARNPR